MIIYVQKECEIKQTHSHRRLIFICIEIKAKSHKLTLFCRRAGKLFEFLATTNHRQIRLDIFQAHIKSSLLLNFLLNMHLILFSFLLQDSRSLSPFHWTRFQKKKEKRNCRWFRGNFFYSNFTWSANNHEKFYYLSKRRRKRTYTTLLSASLKKSSIIYSSYCSS